MTNTLDAIYENGALRLLEPLELAEGARVKIAVETDGNHDISQHEISQREVGPKSSEEILAIIQGIAAQTVDYGEVETASRDHDKYLYGKNEGT